jgi:D-amino peptidase
MRNLLVDELDSRIDLISGSIKPYSMVQGIEEGYDLAFFIGYHAMAGTMKGVINHTYYGSDLCNEVRFNGERIGEVEINAAVAGYYGTPIGLVTGDSAVSAEANHFLGDIETVAVKDGVGRYSARIMHPERSRALIQAAAKRAVERAGSFKPYCPAKPYRLELELANTAQADRAGLIPGVERVGERVLAYTSDDMLMVYRAFLAMLALGSTAR